MSKYSKDRSFSEFVHDQIALKLIYEPLKWKPVSFASDYGLHIDRSDGIDYVFLKDRQLITVQERFRDQSYRHFSDFTIRYRRDKNKNLQHQESEFYKLKAQYFIYGIVNGSKLDRASCTQFLKYAVVDLPIFYDKVRSGLIKVSQDKMRSSRIVNNDCISCPVLKNKDGSSSFIPIDITQLITLWGSHVVIAQHGYV